MNIAELYAHAIAIEREALARYSEFAERMSDLGNDAAAEVFATLARLEAAHLERLLERTRAMALPALAAGQYAWLDAAAPETAAREFVLRLLSPRQALQIALAGENRAAVFFETMAVSAADPMLRALACEMATEELEHIGVLETLLAATPDPVVDWASVYERDIP
jgi:rubrerythrin